MTNQDYLMMICEHLTPTTLAAVVSDLRGSPLHGARDIVRNSLIDSVGDSEAETLIWNADHDDSR